MVRFTLVLQQRLVLREVSHPHRVAWSGASQVHHNEKENKRDIGFSSLLLNKKSKVLHLSTELFPLLL